jgi:hypothetical protein
MNLQPASQRLLEPARRRDSRAGGAGHRAAGGQGPGRCGYGLYSLVTAIVGYFAVIDINVTAGSVKYIAEFNARKDQRRIDETVFFGLAVYALLGRPARSACSSARTGSSPACSRCRPRWRGRPSPPAGWRRSASSSASCRAI